MKALVLSLGAYAFVGLVFLQTSVVFSQSNGMVFRLTIEQLKHQLQTARHDTTRMRLMADLSFRYHRNHQSDSMYVYIKPLFSLATKYNAISYIGISYRNLSIYYEYKNLYIKSESALQKSIEFFLRNNDINNLIKSRMRLTNLYNDMGDFKQAVTVSLDNITFFDKHNATDAKLATYAHLVDIYEILDDTPHQIFYLDLYVKTIATSKNVAMSILGYDLKAKLFEKQGAYGKAWPYRQKAIKLSRGFIIPAWTVEYLTNAATNLRKRNQAKAAIPYLQEAVEVSKTINDPHTKTLLFQEISKNKLLTDKPEAAVQAAQLALAAVQLGSRPQSRLEARKNLTTIQEATGHFQGALQSFKAYEALKDSLFNVEKNVKIARIQAEYDVAKKEATIQMLHKNEQLQQLKLLKQDRRLLLASQERQRLIVGIGFLMFALGVYVYYLRQARITQQQLVSQNQEIEAKSTQLKEVNALKDRLFSIIGHDLRGPVASLQNSFTQFKAGRHKDLTLLDKEIRQLSYSLDNLLYWSLTQREGLRVHLHQVDLADLVNEMLEGFEGLIRQKNLVVRFVEFRKTTWLDENLTMLVMRNILHNAIKFTPPGGTILLTIRHETSMTHLAIRDTGVGMDVNNPNRLNKKEGRGTGLGLGLSQELMKVVGGELQLESRIGQGTTVILSWPAGQH